ncbi:MAG TPA: cytochrome C oxidase subunit IV family protein [Nitrolancea sp.]|jgi:cytochrome c oxidase subunit 4|nr:cytochrome C oxidase subunit IV family protein [Nitrolancea sp.]
MSSQPVSHHAHELPGPRTYLIIAVILAIFTVVETATYYINISEYIITIALLIFMTCKFVLVVGYYMHLKFEKRLLPAVFTVGILTSLGGMLAMIAMYHNF